MNDIIIRFSDLLDIDNIMAFIKEHWNSKNIVGNSLEFFKYQNLHNGKVTFVIAENEIDKKIVGILGYIPYSYGEKASIANVLWKSIDKTTPMLGFKLLNFLVNNINAKTYLSCGINTSTIVFYKRMGYFTDKLKHFYMLSDRENYKIATIENKIMIENEEKLKYSLLLLDDFEKFSKIFDEKNLENRIPYKSKEYIDYRFFKHPIYKYKAYGIINDKSECNSVIFTREQEYNSIKILRIIDFIGVLEDLSHIYSSLRELINVNDYEYIDFYQYGIPDEIMNAGGFVENKKEDRNVIPDYFGPFLNKNIDIYFFINEKDNAIIFKGDSDQDRPNLL